MATIRFSISRWIFTAVLLPASQASLAIGDAPLYDSAASTDRPVYPGAGFNTPEEDGRPGQYFFLKAVDAVKRNQYKFAVDMYKVSASWAYKPAEYNLGVMYAKGEGVPVDRPRSMAWMALAAERNDQDYVDARELIYSLLDKDEFARANEIWRDLKKTYGDDVALRRAKARWARVRTEVTGSHVGAVGNLAIGTGDRRARTKSRPDQKSPADGFAVWGGGVLGGSSMDGSTAYEQLRASNNPYDPKFERAEKGATKTNVRVDDLIPMSGTPASVSPSSTDTQKQFF